MTRQHPLPADGRRRPRRDERGAAAVEFSLVILPLIFVLYGLIAFGMMFALKQSMTNAAAEGARSALGAPAGTEVAVAKATVAQRMGWLGAKYSAADSPDPVVAPCVNDPSKNCITVRINYPYGTKPLIPLAPGLGLFTPPTFGTEATVRLS